MTIRQVLATVALATCSALQAAPHAHEHGVARLAVAVEGNTLSIELDAPLDGLLGFERVPRSDAEKRAAADLLARLKSPAGLFTPDAAAGCKPAGAEVKAPLLEPGAQAYGEHADIEVQLSFACTQPQALRTLDVGLFEAFKRLQRIEVQVVGTKGQAKVVLRRPARSIKLAP